MREIKRRERERERAEHIQYLVDEAESLALDVRVSDGGL